MTPLTRVLEKINCEIELTTERYKRANFGNDAAFHASSHRVTLEALWFCVDAIEDAEEADQP